MRLNYVRRCTPGVTDIYAHICLVNDAARDGYR